MRNGKRYSTLPSRSDVPPVGSAVKSFERTCDESECPFGSHYPSAIEALVQPAF